MKLGDFVLALAVALLVLWALSRTKFGAQLFVWKGTIVGES